MGAGVKQYLNDILNKINIEPPCHNGDRIICSKSPIHCIPPLTFVLQELFAVYLLSWSLLSA
jgi:hypothetical protein